ncbi:GNAT family N-acetyltransferase [Rhodobacterales bacterium HKCCE3408]|nr:GNAT family N-acetyltransferase [Rhodobacterales bacterium HKCCE3408]
MLIDDDHFELRVARDEAGLRAAQRLRYAVFVEELGADGPMVDHAARLERDRFDAAAGHLMLVDRRRDEVVAVTRLMGEDGAARMGQFYSEGEFDLSALRRSGRRLMELGRTCLHPDYRGGTALLRLWQAVAEHVEASGAEILFGTVSFPGTDPAPVAQALSWLHRDHLAPEGLRPVARGPEALAMDILPDAEIDRAAAARALPALLKAYLRLGGTVGAGAWRDVAFNCIDVCLVLDTAAMSDRHRTIYTGRPG